MSGLLQNLDLLSVGTAVASTGILGFVVFLNNRKSITNKTFFAFSIVTIIWGVANYLHYQTQDAVFALWSLRLVFFFAVLQSFSIFQLFYVFPAEKVRFSKKYVFILVPVVLFTALLTLTPFVSSEVTGFSSEGVPENIKGSGIILFGLVSMMLVAGSLYLILKKIKHGSRIQRKPLVLMLIGTMLMFGLIIPLNFILPAFFEKFTFLPLSAVFTFPFAAFTAYAISKHRLFGAKVIATESLAFVLSIAVLFQVIFSEGLAETIFHASIFLLVLSFSILLIRSVLKEVRQREQLQELSAALQHANLELQKLDSAKSEFISIASHQLRTPLTVIKGYASLILDKTIPEGSIKAKEVLQKVMFSTDQLVKLVASMLDLSRIESGKIRYDMKKGDLLGLVERVVEEFKKPAQEKNINLKIVKSGSSTPQFLFDADKMHDVIMNMVDNAIKYTALYADTTDRTVTITYEHLIEPRSRARISVRDHGMGINKQDIKKLFTKFARTPEAQKADPGGMGIGIYFVKRVMEDHGGSAGVESEGSGKGSTFWVELPLAPKLQTVTRSRD